MKISSPKYQQIAADIALKIARGEYMEGEKVFVRSALASQYGVSSETARRAICVLVDMKIVQATKGSGVIIKSKKQALSFVKKYDSVSQMSELKKNIYDEIDQSIKQSMELKSMFSDLIYRTERFHFDNPFTPFKIEITDDALYIGKNLSESNFWHNTMATVVGIQRGEEIIISPGPYAVFSVGDIFHFVGDEDCYARVEKFLFSKE